MNLLKMPLCESFHEWWNTGGMGVTCQLPFAHKGDHRGRDGYQWTRTAEEDRLVAEVHRLKDKIDAVRGLANDLDGNMTGKFFAQEIRNRITGG